MKVVAVSQRVDVFPDRNETRDALDQRLITFLLFAGYLPVPVPNGLHKEMPDGRQDHDALVTWLTVLNPLAIVLSGGNDIGQCQTRDLTEGWLLDYAKTRQRPVLGICRGMQMMAHWSGVNLKPVKSHVGTQHHISGEITGVVNSYHAYSIGRCPDGFAVMARSEDGEIEAIRHLSRSWAGWMWHPERDENFSDRDVQRVKALFGG